MNIKIIKECSDFLKESNGNPLLRSLPERGADFRKIKVRKKKSESKFDSLFNSVFIEHPDLRQRCIFANGLKTINEVDDSHSHEERVSLFYVFPINGYKYMYSLNVIDSSKAYKDTLESFVDIMEEHQAVETFSEVLKYDYVSTNLEEGIKAGSEIILYGIPYYYAIKANTVKSYSTLFSL